MSGMAEVIVAHCDTDDGRCSDEGCDWAYPDWFELYEGSGADSDRLAAVADHIADTLSAAGFGDARKQQARLDALMAELVAREDRWKKAWEGGEMSHDEASSAALEDRWVYVQLADIRAAINVTEETHE